MIRKEETRRPVGEVGDPVGGAGASVKDVKVKLKKILKLLNYFCNFKYSCMLISSVFLLFIVNIVQELIDFIVILCL